MDQLTERLVEYAQALSYEDLPPDKPRHDILALPRFW